MTWFHIYDLLQSQRRFFPHGDIRPFAPLPAGWAAIEAMFRLEESAGRDIIDAAIDEFISRGSWPGEISDRLRVLIRGRLDFAADTALRLAVPISPEVLLLPKPPHISDDELFVWLLVYQWKAVGFESWLLDLRCTFDSVQRRSKKTRDSIPLPRVIERDEPPTWHSNN